MQRRSYIYIQTLAIYQETGMTLSNKSEDCTTIAYRKGILFLTHFTIYNIQFNYSSAESHPIAKITTLLMDILINPFRKNHALELYFRRLV